MTTGEALVADLERALRAAGAELAAQGISEGDIDAFLAMMRPTFLARLSAAAAPAASRIMPGWKPPPPPLRVRPVHMLKRNVEHDHEGIAFDAEVCPGCDEPECRYDHGLSDDDLSTYYRFIVAFSAGKDSIALVLYLLERGVPPGRIELWHHDVDGREGSTLMDWPCTRAYCAAFAAALGIPIYYSWKVGGFEGEMLRENAPTALTAFEEPTPEGGVVLRYGGKGERGTAGTRLRFPQVSKDLTVRWCSAYLKIDVAGIAIKNQARFLNVKTALLSGERAEESPGRAAYLALEPDRSDNRNGEKVRRHVDRWRPVHGWPERAVWAIIERWGVNPHPAYRCGWGRVSCSKCIFGDPDQWASARVVDPLGFAKVHNYELRFGKTIKHLLSVVQLADQGTPYEMTAADLAAARSATFDEPILLTPDAWRLPRGAYGDTTGPT